MKPYEDRKARERMAAGGGDRKSGSADRRTPVLDPGRVTEKLAEKAGVGARTINRAIAVRVNGVPEVNQAVAIGEVSLNHAGQHEHRQADT